MAHNEGLTPEEEKKVLEDEAIIESSYEESLDGLDPREEDFVTGVPNPYG